MCGFFFYFQKYKIARKACILREILKKIRFMSMKRTE